MGEVSRAPGSGGGLGGGALQISKLAGGCLCAAGRIGCLASLFRWVAVQVVVLLRNLML